MRLLLLLLPVLLSSCGDTQATGNAYATEIPGPEGARCFAIYSGGEVISGNCIAD